MKRNVIIFWGFFVTLACLRVIFSLNAPQPDIGQCLKRVVSGTGTISEEPSRTETGQVLTIEVEQMKSSEVAGITCLSPLTIRAKAKLYPKFKFDDHVSFTGKLNAPINFKSADGRSFDYKGYLAKNDIFYEIKSAVVEAIPVTLETTGVFGWMNMTVDSISGGLYHIRRSFVANLNRTLGEPHSALAAGLVVGEKSALGPQLLEDFRTVGLIHIVVLSGFNITIVADALRRMLSRLPRVWGIVIGGIGMFLSKGLTWRRRKYRSYRTSLGRNCHSGKK